MPTISDFKTMPPSPYDQPAIVGYNRLESSPVSSDYTKSLQASVHDALWLLTRQWQMGEFEAEDAGSALKAKVLADQRKLSQAFLGNSTIANNTPLGTIPLETLVEQELATSDLSMRIESGNLLKQVIMDNNPSDYWTFLSLFRLALLESNLVLIILDEIKREPQSLELFNAVKNKALDGYTAYFTLSRWTTEIDAPAILNRASAMKIKDEFCLQFETLYGKSANPTSNTPVAWQSQQMEYKFSIVNQNNDTALTVDQYANGSLDWYDFDISKIGAGVTPSTCTFMPTPVIFEGMPKPRWWEMEDSTVNFGDVNAKKTDLPTLLLIEFALIYGNDWLLVPYPMEVNTLCQIQGILVTDVFGCHTFIPPLSTPNSQVASWEKWAMFRHSGDAAKATAPWFYLAPTLLKSLKHEPIESVSFLRDEMANLVWAFENIVPGAMGNGQKSYEMAQQEYQEPSPSSTPADPEISFYYKLGTKVPFYQVPFLPVKDSTSFQRGRMPEGSNPRGVLLREIMPYFYIREEEVPRTGVNVTRRWQRTRWTDGSVCQWIGREKETGKGEGSSGLQFDLIRQAKI